ncbi:unnamed protein product, partial [Mesorhabditis spiculigera]
MWCILLSALINWHNKTASRSSSSCSPTIYHSRMMFVVRLHNAGQRDCFTPFFAHHAPNAACLLAQLRRQLPPGYAKSKPPLRSTMPCLLLLLTMVLQGCRLRQLTQGNGFVMRHSSWRRDSDMPSNFDASRVYLCRHRIRAALYTTIHCSTTSSSTWSPSTTFTCQSTLPPMLLTSTGRILAASSTSTTTATTFAAVTTTSSTSSTSGVSTHKTWAAASIWIDKSAYQDFFKLPAPSSTTESTSIVPALLFFHQAGIQHGPLTTSSAKSITSAAAFDLNTATSTTSCCCPDYSQQFRCDTNSRMQGFNTQALKYDSTRHEAPSSLFTQTSPFQTFKLQDNDLWMECGSRAVRIRCCWLLDCCEMSRYLMKPTLLHDFISHQRLQAPTRQSPVYGPLLGPPRAVWSTSSSDFLQQVQIHRAVKLPATTPCCRPDAKRQLRLRFQEGHRTTRRPSSPLRQAD